MLGEVKNGVVVSRKTTVVHELQRDLVFLDGWRLEVGLLAVVVDEIDVFEGRAIEACKRAIVGNIICDTHVFLNFPSLPWHLIRWISSGRSRISGGDGRRYRSLELGWYVLQLLRNFEATGKVQLFEIQVAQRRHQTSSSVDPGGVSLLPFDVVGGVVDLILSAFQKVLQIEGYIS